MSHHLAHPAGPGVPFNKSPWGTTPSPLPACPACGRQETGSPAEKKDALCGRAAGGTRGPGCQAVTPHPSQTRASGFHREAPRVYTALICPRGRRSLRLAFERTEYAGERRRRGPASRSQGTCLQGEGRQVRVAENLLCAAPFQRSGPTVAVPWV